MEHEFDGLIKIVAYFTVIFKTLLVENCTRDPSVFKQKRYVLNLGIWYIRGLFESGVGAEGEACSLSTKTL